MENVISAVLVGFLKIFSSVLDLCLYPIFAFFQKPLTFKKSGGKLTRSSGTRVILECAEEEASCPEGYGRFRTVYGFFENVCNEKWGKKCLGVRPVTESFEGSFRGNPVEKLRKAPTYEWTTYGGVLERVDRVSAGLAHRQVRRGDVVMIYADTKPEWLIAALACMKNGIVVSTMFTTMSTDAVLHAVEETQAKVVVTDRGLVPKLSRTLQKSSVGAVQTVVYFEDVTVPHQERSDLFELVPFGSLESSRQPKVEEAADPDGVAMVMYTSGTSGRPKGVVIKNETLTRSVVDCGALYHRTVRRPDDPGRVYIAYLPQAHILEFVQELIQLTMDTPLAFSSPRYLTDASPQVPAGEKGDMTVARPSSLVAVPLVLERFHQAILKKVERRGRLFAAVFRFCLDYKRGWRRRGFETPLLDRLVFGKIKEAFGGNLQQILSGGAPLNPSVQEDLSLCIPGLAIVQGYGLTETLGGNCLSHYNQKGAGTVGYPSPATIIALEDWKEGGYTCSGAGGPSGEILMGGPRVADGYFKCHDEESAASFFTDEDGTKWFRTGDIGRIDENNMLAIVDRKKQLVKVQNGEYISLTKIETTLCLHPLVSMACVVAEPYRPHVVALVVVDKETFAGKAVTADSFSKDVKEFLTNNNLAGAEVPKAYTLLTDEWTPDSGMVTGAMKLRRKQIESRYRNEINAMFAN